MKRLLLASALAIVSVSVACSSEDVVSSDSSDIVSGDRWVLPSEVLVVGAKARVDYDAAPKWSGTAACAKALREGTRDVGEFLRDRFPQVSSIGGYACRKNTADTTRMSVHGTGRALDVFIPKRAGEADGEKGDAVANWLVLNASKIGVQLVIWNRTVWRANGKNASRYGGPHPHDDHIHVEVTNEAARLETPWFANKNDDEDASTKADAGADAKEDATTKDAGSKDPGTVDSGKPPPPPPPPPEEEEEDPPPADNDPPKDPPPAKDDKPKDEDNSAPTGNGEEHEGPAEDHDWEVPEGETGGTDSLGPSSNAKPKKSADASDESANSGCSTSPVNTKHTAPVFLGLALAALLVGRRKQR